MSKETAQLTWLQGAFDDGWIKTRAFMRLSGVEVLGIKAFLSAAPAGQQKFIRIYDDEQLLHEEELKRSTVKPLTVTVPEASRNSVICLECDYAEVPASGRDLRERGFLCVAYRINDGEWIGMGKDRPAVARGSDSGTVSANAEEYRAVEREFDANFYRTQFRRREYIPDDLVHHYLTEGAKQGRDPCDWFSTSYYFANNAAVTASGVNPFAHFLLQGRREGRRPSSSALSSVAPGNEAGSNSAAIYAEHQNHCAAGGEFEEFDPSIVRLRKPAVKALAYYLPQFHPIPENDEWWGKGFTEWRNVVRGQPRFRGHYQPRVPRDLGFYDLRNSGIMAEQAALAKAAGIHGFCFYYYNFNGRRLLERPIEAFLRDASIDMPFALIWANENWTRAWDGRDKEVLISQIYRTEDEDALLADLARHFADPRYIRVGNRPLFFLYRPALIADPGAVIARWREKFETQHSVSPLLFMAQGFGDNDPRPHGLDGAIEFPPHKLATGVPAINGTLDILDPAFTGHVLNYAAVVQRSCDEPAPEFPLIKAATPSWDNESRRPGRGMALHGSSPRAYGDWLRSLVDFAIEHPVSGERFVAINAWNEWAEGAYLEPDAYYGSAYLNATARALTQTPALTEGRSKVLIVGHDAYRHGAQLLVQNMAATIARQFGAEVTILVCGEGPLLSEYQKICNCQTVARGDGAGLRRILEDLKANGYARAIVNTTVSGWTVPALKAQGFAVVSLIHELPALIQEYGLESYAAAIAAGADSVVFPSFMVRDSFMTIVGGLKGQEAIAPQGLYKRELVAVAVSKADARRKLGIAPEGKIVINVGYADSRKGFDIFVDAAKALIKTQPDVRFYWVGDATPDIKRWLLPDALSALGEHLSLTGYTEDVAQYYAAADAFLLTSREDPYPSVVLEAIAAGLPVVGLEGTTGCAGLISRFGRLAGRNDPAGIAAALSGVLGETGETAPAARRDFVRESARFDQYCLTLLRRFDRRLPAISVVVPNYNYARYLPQRLTSIFKQTQPVLEVIVLDDQSSDGSAEVIQSTASAARRDIDLVVNGQNSGSVFRQWLKGAEQARGDLVWIAEADDTADERFLEALAVRFEDPEVGVAFSDSWQIGPEGEHLGSSYRPYVSQAAPGLFDSSFVMTGAAFLQRCLSVKNVILNVSGVLWRKAALLECLAAAGEALSGDRVAGDWRLYIEACSAGWSFAYDARAFNGHRRHGTSVTHALAKQQHYGEVLAMQALSGSRTELDPALLHARATHRADVRRALGLEEIADREPNSGKENPPTRALKDRKA